ncbi:MAG: RDD family protein [Dehalococcoidia bacterium]
MACPYCAAKLSPGLLFCLSCGRYCEGNDAPRQEAAVIHEAAARASLRERWVEPAGYIARFIAYVVDTVIGVGALLALLAAFALTNGRTAGFDDLTWAAGRMWLPAFLVEVGYFALFEASNLRATPGKLLTGLAVTDGDGDQLGLIHALARAVAKTLMVGVVPFVIFIAFFTSKRQTLYDLITGTVVVEREAS